MWKTLKNLFSGGGGGVDPAPPEKRGDSQPAVSSGEDSKGDQSSMDLAEYFAELGLEEGADLSAVRRAWKEGLKQVHMGHYSDDPETRRQAQDRTRRINEAYRALQETLF